MITTRVASRATPKFHRTFRQKRTFTSRPHSPYVLRRQQHFIRSVAVVAAFASAATVYEWYTGGHILPEAHADAPQAEPVPIVFEKTRKPKNASKEETRDRISSQHLQVRKSWENPGVYSWGANDGKVAAPDAKESLIRNPRWMSFFDGMLLRDMKLSRDFGAAINEQGDLLQWGKAFSKDSVNPVVTLKGKQLTNLILSKDRVLALSASGKVYSLSMSEDEQKLGPKPTESSSWLPFWSTTSSISYRPLDPGNLSWNEKITSIAGGLEHAVLLTSKGRVFTSASGSEDYPQKGQLGIPGLTWFTKPPGPYDQPHEVHGLHGFKVTQIAAGDYHSVVLDNKGRVFAWGDNQRGQLGIGETNKETTFFDAPSLLPISKLYAGTQQKPSVTSVAAGGNTTFLTVDAIRVADPSAEDSASAMRGVGRVTADVWACGHGIWGQLGNGRWTHVQSLPTKIAPLSGLFEYDEKKRSAVPIRLRDISVGATHVAATMDNVTYLAAGDHTNENDTNWGADVVFFGNNEYFQLGTGRRNNCTTPTYIQPLNRTAEVVEGKRPKAEEHRFHATPKATVKLGERWVSFEQKVVCGRGVSAVYSRIC